MALISIISSESLTLISCKNGEVTETNYTLLGGFVKIFTFFMMKKICEKRQYKFGKRKKKLLDGLVIVHLESFCYMDMHL